MDHAMARSMAARFAPCRRSRCAGASKRRPCKSHGRRRSEASPPSRHGRRRSEASPPHAARAQTLRKLNRGGASDSPGAGVGAGRDDAVTDELKIYMQVCV
jgi:hypothetical protein